MNTEQFFAILEKIKLQYDYIRCKFDLEPSKLLINEPTYRNLYVYCSKFENHSLSPANEFQSRKIILGMRVVIDKKIDDDEVEVVLPIRELLK